MRSTKSIMLIVIALGCGLVASIGISQVMDSQTRGEPAIQMETIFVAASNVAPYSKLGMEHVREEEWPVDKIPPKAARSLDEFEGLSPRYPLFPGEVILTDKLSDSNGRIPSERIPEGLQVVSVKVDKESALSGLVKPGDRVDILVFIRGGQGIETGTRTILRNVTVFAVNDQITRSPENERSIDAKTVSLLVEPEQSERLLLAKKLGTIHLALRKPGDESDINTEGARPGDLDGNTETPDAFGVAKEEKPTNGLFGMLTNIQRQDSSAVDSSTAATAREAEGEGWKMVIMSPGGILGSYSGSNGDSEGGLAPLPTELPSTAATAPDTRDESTETEPQEPTDEELIEEDEQAEVEPNQGFLDPAVLGL